MTISSGDQNKYRGALHSTGAILNRVPKQVLATAQINQTSFTYPVSSFTVDNLVTPGTFKPGHLVLIGTTPGAWDVTVGVVSKPMSGDTFYIDAKSQGDPGWRRSIMTPLADNQYVTVIKFRPAQGLLSSIRQGIFYKRWDIPYSGQGVNPDPIVRMGDWIQAWAVDGIATVPLTVDPFIWGRAGTPSVAWGLDGGSVNTGDIDELTLTADYEPGFYEIECTVTDPLGKSRTGYRYLWVNVDDPADDNAPFSYRYPSIQITDDRQEITGRELEIGFNGNLAALDELFPGQGFLLTEFPKFRGQTLEGDSFVGSFAGYAIEGNKQTSFKKRKTDLKIVSPLKMAEYVPAAVQEINEVPNPASWAEVTKLLSNPVGAVWYISAHHAPYLIDGHDMTFSNELLLLRRQTFQFRSTNIGGQIKTVADMMKGVIGNKSSGRLRMLRSPMYMSLDDRNALDNLWTWLPGDITGEFERAFMARMETSQINGYAFAFDGSQSIPFQSLAPGFVRAQADGTDSITPFIVTVSEGQQRVNDVTGHAFAEATGLPRFNITADRNIDICEPVDVDLWHTFNVPASYDSQGYGWINERAIVTRVTRSWAYERGVKKSIQIEMQPETYGVPGITIPVDRGGANNWYLSDWNPGVFDPYQLNMPDIGVTLPVMLAINDSGSFARTFSFTERQVKWEPLAVPSGRVLSFSVDWDSPYFSDPDAAISFFVLTNDNGSLHVYTLIDARAEVPEYTEFTNSPLTGGTGFKGVAKIKASRSSPDFVLVTWRNQTGVMFSRSTAGTPSLGAAAHIGATVSDVDHDNESMGMDLIDTFQAVIAPLGSTDLAGSQAYGLYVATGTGAFSLVTSNPLGSDESAFVGFVTTSEPDRAYVSYVKLDPPTPPAALGVVTFDPGGETDYSITGAGIVADGHPDNCAWAAFNAAGAGGQVAVSVACQFLNGDYNIEDVEFDAKLWQGGGTVFGAVYHYQVRAFAGGRAIGNAECSLRENYGDGWSRWGARADEMRLLEVPDTITVTAYYTFTSSNPFTIAYAYIDNVVITGTPIQLEGQRTLYTVQTSIPSWSDVTPNGKQIPQGSYTLVYNPADTGHLSLIGLTEAGKAYLLDSLSSGSSWSLVSRTTYAGLARGGDVLLAWGINALAISPDAGKTFYSRLGDWVASVGTVGEIKQVGGIL